MEQPPAFIPFDYDRRTGEYVTPYGRVTALDVLAHGAEAFTRLWHRAQLLKSRWPPAWLGWNR